MLYYKKNKKPAIYLFEIKDKNVFKTKRRIKSRQFTSLRLKGILLYN